MKSFKKVTIVLGLLLSVVQIHAGAVTLQDHDYAKLVGLWKGEHTKTGTGGGQEKFRQKVELVIKENNTGEFKNKAKTWLTQVEIREGKVLLKYGNVERLFSYDEKGKKFILSVSYYTEGSGRKLKNQVILKK